MAAPNLPGVSTHIHHHWPSAQVPLKAETISLRLAGVREALSVELYRSGVPENNPAWHSQKCIDALQSHWVIKDIELTR